MSLQGTRHRGQISTYINFSQVVGKNQFPLQVFQASREGSSEADVSEERQILFSGIPHSILMWFCLLPFLFCPIYLLLSSSPPGLAVAFQSYPLYPWNSRESMTTGFAVLPPPKKRGYCRHFLTILNLHKFTYVSFISALFSVAVTCCCAHARGSCCHLSVSVLLLPSCLQSWSWNIRQWDS